MKKHFVTTCIILFCSLTVCALPLPHRMFIWEGVDGMQTERSVLESFIPQNPNGTAVIVCPGGSYHHLDLNKEGRTTAQWFAQQGVTAFVLQYRTAKDGYHAPAMQQDLQRAIQLVRENANEWNLNPDKIGLIGFSAGGHLVAWAAEHGNDNLLLELHLFPTVKLNANFVIPVYPVVSMQDTIAHQWSRRSLLGLKPTQEEKDAWSLELTVSDSMPPVYLVACKDDPVVQYENSVVFFKALLQKKVDVTFASYEWGGHGFGMADTAFMRAFNWNEALRIWLCSHGFIQGPF